MEAIRITDNPSINLLGYIDTDDTTNPILEVQASADSKEVIFQQIALYSEFELNQAEQIHKLVSQKQQLLKLSWLSATGHLRPGIAKGLPLDQANSQSSQLDSQVRQLLKSASR